MPRVRLLSGFWADVVRLARTLPDATLLRLVRTHLAEVLPGDASEVLARCWSVAASGTQLPQQGEVTPRPAPHPLVERQPKPRGAYLPALRAPSGPTAPERPIEGGTPEFERFRPTARVAPAPSRPLVLTPKVGRRPVEPETQPVHLTVLPVEQVRREFDRFRCEPYEAHITARTCLSRQYTAAELQQVGRGAARQRLGTQSQFVTCANCPVGKRVQKQVVAVDKGLVKRRVSRVRDGRIPPRYATGPVRE